MASAWLSRAGGFLAASAIALSTGAAVTASAGSAVVSPLPAWTAYVPNEGSSSVTPINLSTNTPGAAVPGVYRPFGIAITPDGSTAYVANTFANAVTPINLSSNATGTPIQVGTNPVDIAITPDGRTAYVVNNGSNDVTPVNLATNTAGAAIPVGAGPYSIAITPDGSTAYVANTGSNNVTPINLASNTPRTAIALRSSPQWISITPDGSTAYVAEGGSNDVTPINLITGAAGIPIRVPGGPYSIAITADGGTAYVSQFYAFTVTPVDLRTGTLGTAIPVGAYPAGLAITPDGSTVYVTDDGSNAVTSINVATNTVQATIPVGTNPASIAITPDQAPVAALAATIGAAGNPSRFDASASTVAFGRITSYGWNFGDGSTTTTSVPTTAHTYAVAGGYTVSVSETDSAGTSTTRVFTGKTVSRNGGPSASIAMSVLVPLPPAITIQGNQGSYTVDQQVTITCTATDTGLGVVSPSCGSITGPAYGFGLGEHSFTFTASDLAGNTASITVTFTVIDTAAGLASLTSQLVSSPGVAAALTSKLAAIGSAPNALAKAGQVNAFLNQVSAQTGKSISVADAAVLTFLVQQL
jgi:YVTN family beta-propeller protein